MERSDKEGGRVDFPATPHLSPDMRAGSGIRGGDLGGAEGEGKAKINIEGKIRSRGRVLTWQVSVSLTLALVSGFIFYIALVNVAPQILGSNISPNEVPRELYAAFLVATAASLVWSTFEWRAYRRKGGRGAEGDYVEVPFGLIIVLFVTIYALMTAGVDAAWIVMMNPLRAYWGYMLIPWYIHAAMAVLPVMFCVWILAVYRFDRCRPASP
ncbi:MAG: hypothetical protein QXG08_06130 [Candidatus Methanomethyliaceae archaeon]